MCSIQVNFAELEGAVEAQEDVLAPELIGERELLSVPHNLPRDETASFACAWVERLVDQRIVR
jgi:hypothetical protein